MASLADRMAKEQSLWAVEAACRHDDKRLHCPKFPSLKLAVRNSGNEGRLLRLFLLMDMLRLCSYFRHLWRWRIEKNVMMRGQRAFGLAAPIKHKDRRAGNGIRDNFVAVAR